MSNPERWQRFRQLPTDIKERLNQLPALFEQEQVQLAYLFGSLSQGENGQDVDLALLTGGEPASQLRAVITDRLGTERVDLVDLRRASPVVRFEILRTGQLLYAASEAIEEEFVLSTLRLYKDTNWLRRRQNNYLKERMEAWSLNQSQ